MKALLATCIVLMACGLGGAQEAEETTTTHFKNHARQYKDATLIPLRETAEWLGATVEWRSPEIIVTRGETKVTFRIGSGTATRNGQVVKLALPPRVIKDTTFVPFRFLGEALGAVVEYEEDSGDVYVYDGERSAYATVEVGDPPRWWPRNVPPTLENYRHVTVDKCTGMASGACSYHGQCQGREPEVE